MDLREAQQLEGVTIIDPKAVRTRQLIVGVLALAAIGLLGWIVFGRPADITPTAPPVASTAPPTAPVSAPPSAPAAGADSPARQAAGAIPGEAASPMPPLRPIALAPTASNGGAASVEPQAAAPTESNSGAASAQPQAAAASASPVAATPPTGDQAAAVPGLKMDTEFASAKRIVPFAFNRVRAGPLGTLAIRELAPLAKQANKVYVRGRTDSLGNPATNRKVAVSRAYTVYSVFLREGVRADNMRLTYCTECFISSNATEAGRRANRRVEVELLMPPDEIARLPKPVHAPESPPPLIAPLASSEILQTPPR